MILAERWAQLPVRLGRRLPPTVRRAVNVARGIDTPALVERPPGHRVAVLAPHPDDELLGCGGTLIKHLAAGEEVAVLFVTSGEATAGLAGRPAEERRARREGDARAAAVALGLAAGAVDFLHHPDGRVGQDHPGAVPLGEALARRRPDLVYAPFPVDAHRDHRATTTLLAAALPALPSVATVALYEVWTPLPPTTVVEVTDQMEAKLAALGRYGSALASVDYRHTARGLGAYRSAQGLHGRGYAEAFVVVTPAQLADLLGRLDGMAPAGSPGRGPGPRR